MATSFGAARELTFSIPAGKVIVARSAFEAVAQAIADKAIIEGASRDILDVEQISNWATSWI